MMNSIKSFCNSLKRDEDYDFLAKEMNFNVDKAAQKLVQNDDDCNVCISLIYD